MPASSHTFVDLFSGAGLFSYAFIRQGFRPIISVELDESACETYRTNIGDHVVCDSVKVLTPPDDCDVVIAGPPCQGFSTLNRNRKFDPRNELSFEVLRWVDKAKPRVVIFENVAPFADSLICKSLIRRLKRRKYSVAVGVVNSADFGVPQFRRRTILIASQGEQPTLPTSRIRRHRTVGEAWAGLSEEPTNRNFHFAPKPSPLALARFQAIPEGGDRRSVMKQRPDLSPPSWWRVAENDNTGVWGRMQMDSPAPTVRTQFQNPSKGRYIHPTANRVITIREGARLQNIPNRWKFVGHRTHITRQIGNGVPINLGEAIASHCALLLR